MSPLIITGGAWITQGTKIIEADGWGDLPLTASPGDYAILRDGGVLLRWASLQSSLDASGRKWIPDAIFDPDSPNHLNAEVLDWLEAKDTTSTGDGNPIDTWPSRAGTGDYTASGAARPSCAVAGGPDNEPRVIFNGTSNVLVKDGAGNDILQNVTNTTLIIGHKPSAAGGNFTWWYASTGASASLFRFGIYGTVGVPVLYARTGASDELSTSANLRAQAADSWGILTACRTDAGEIGGLASTPNITDNTTSTGLTGNTANTASLGIYLGANISADFFNGSIYHLMVVANLSMTKTRDVVQWMHSRITA